VVKPKISVGCCGWGYLREKEFSKSIERKFRSKLQAYAQLFQSVEVNSTFYRIPKVGTAEKWRREADEMNRQFEFTVKASRIITHIDRFGSRASLDAFSRMLDICAVLRARTLLLQSPASFRPTPENLNRLEKFFSAINPGEVRLAWEPRGRWWDAKDEISSVCEKFKLICCVDPFRNEPFLSRGVRLAYFRLHGLGEPSMYQYQFTKSQLTELMEKCIKLSKIVDLASVFFNNSFMYANAFEFQSMLHLS
jgi:uncharacterized protein YecE (DUF72 family)